MKAILYPLIALIPLTAACQNPPTTPGGANGEPSPTCVNGWSTPAANDPIRTAAIGMIRTALELGNEDQLTVVQMRYFTGPEDVGVVAPRREVERWYVEAYLEGDDSVPGRWIARRTDVGAGADYHAARDSNGYEPGIWTADEGDQVPYDPFNPPCTRNHGPYGDCDWGVSGCSPTDSSEIICTGPPPEVMGCLDGT